jgi:hypothetical protein
MESEDWDVPNMLKSSRESVQIGKLYDLVPRKHEFSNLFLEFKALDHDLVLLETMRSCVYRDSIITMITRKLETGVSANELIISQRQEITNLTNQIWKCESTVKKLTSDVVRLKSELTNKQLTDLVSFALTAMEYIEIVSCSTFLNLSKKDRPKLDRIRLTFKELDL